MPNVHGSIRIRPPSGRFANYAVVNGEGIEMRFTMFGAVAPERHSGSYRGASDKICVAFDQQLHDVYRAMLPMNASPQMRQAYVRQLDEVYRILMLVSDIAQTQAPSFPHENNRTHPFNFHFLGPPTYKVRGFFAAHHRMTFKSNSYMHRLKIMQALNFQMAPRFL
ncbi:hypothetical protein CVT24_011018 [Panaeolus cyanescens]|uniref:Uncharacterized protein n=1 Tax=Panaeolus cyanescens TaxID=181874 RepID=A0A409YVC7_9AGAR|nr:hypothetical protein CVT24_011018 [Panaeolus cyanescens]